MKNLTIASEDCKRFWICKGENMFIMSCPTGLIFDEINKICDYDYKIKCKYLTTTTPTSNKKLRIKLIKFKKYKKKKSLRLFTGIRPKTNNWFQLHKILCMCEQSIANIKLPKRSII